MRQPAGLTKSILVLFAWLLAMLINYMCISQYCCMQKYAQVHSKLAFVYYRGATQLLDKYDVKQELAPSEQMKEALLQKCTHVCIRQHS